MGKVSSAERAAEDEIDAGFRFFFGVLKTLRDGLRKEKKHLYVYMLEMTLMCFL